MITLNLTLNQIAVLELYNIEYKMRHANQDGFTHCIEFQNEREYASALEVLTKRW